MAPTLKPLDPEAARRHLEGLRGAWRIDGEGHLTREYTFPDFISALRFVNEVGRLAESLQHHPDIAVGWGYVRLTLWTHSANGLTELDFKLAEAVERLPR
jgi:4a-hydroxytetrahydrobiopterin dehydratase